MHITRTPGAAGSVIEPKIMGEMLGGHEDAARAGARAASSCVWPLVSGLLNGVGQLLLIQVLLNEPPLIPLVESLSPLLPTMTISVGFCEPIEVPLAEAPL